MKDFLMIATVPHSELICDILVVGAGPAGSSAALAAARKGVNVVMVERKAKAGIPVRCAEYMPAPLLGKLGPERHFIVQAIRGMRTFLPGGEVKEMVAPGFTIRRDLLDQNLARAAADAGVRTLFSTRVSAENPDRPLLKMSDGSRAIVKAKVIIGADGPHSTVGGWMDAANRSLIPAIQARVPLTKPLDFTEIYLKKDLYGGYGWLFPKKGEANVGLGCKKAPSPSCSINEQLDRVSERIGGCGKGRSETIAVFRGLDPRRTRKDDRCRQQDAGGGCSPGPDPSHHGGRSAPGRDLRPNGREMGGTLHPGEESGYSQGI